MQGMEKNEAVPPTRDFAGASTARGKARPIELSAPASIRIEGEHQFTPYRCGTTPNTSAHRHFGIAHLGFMFDLTGVAVGIRACARRYPSPAATDPLIPHIYFEK
jgi:hypothetical protein